MRLLTLGSLRFVDSDAAPLAGRRKLLAVVAFLARRAPRLVERELLGTLFWGDRGDELARKSTRQALSELRAALGASLVEGEGRVGVDPSRLTCDANEFEAACARADWPAALELWHGEFLDSCEDLGDGTWRSWLESERERLRRLAALAGQRGYEQCARVGAWDEGVRCAGRWYDVAPLDAGARLALLTALAAAGRRDEAAARFADFVAAAKEGDEGGLPESLVAFGAELTGRAPAIGRASPAEPVAVPPPVAAPLVRPPGSLARALLTPDLVGRDAVMATIDAAWDEVCEGAGRCVVVRGEEGMGKSRVLLEASRVLRARRPTPLVVEARVFASERTQPHRALRGLLLQLTDADGLGASPPPTLATLARVVPEWRERFRALPAADQGAEVGDALLRVLTDLASERPVALLVDDVIDADDASLEAIAAVVRRPPAHVLLVLTARTKGWDRSALRADAARAAPVARTVDVLPLTESDAQALLGSMAPTAPDVLPSLAEALHRESGGNPGLLCLMAAQLAGEGIFAPEGDGRWRLTSPLDLAALARSRDVRTFVRGVTDGLSVDARRVADVASCLGARGRVEQLVRTSGLAPDAVRRHMGELVVARIFRDTGIEVDFEFSGNAIHEIVSSTVPADRRRDVLARLASPAASSGSPSAPNAPRNRWVSAVAALVVVVTTVVAAIATRGRAGHLPVSAPVLLTDVSVSGVRVDSSLARAVYAAASVALQQSRHVTVFPRARVAQTVAMMGRPGADSALGESLAIEVAQREGVRRVLALGLAQLDSTILLTARLVDPLTRADVYAERVTVRSPAGLLPALDRLLQGVRRNVGEPRDSIAAYAASLPRVTTSSLEALQRFADGQQAWTHRDYATAGDLWRRAVQLDSTFSLAWGALAEYAYTQANDRELGNAYLDRALRGLDRLTEREQLHLRQVDARRRGEPDVELRLAGTIARRFPERDTWFNYGTALLRARRCREAIAAFQQALAFDRRLANAYIQVATCLALLQDAPAALQWYAAAERIDSTILLRGNLNQEYGSSLLKVGALDVAERAFRRMAQRPALDERGRGYRSLGMLDMRRGRYLAAVAHFDTAAVLAEQAHVWLSAYRNHLFASFASLALGDTAAARRSLASAQRVVRDGEVRLDPGFALPAVVALVRAGELEAARAWRDTIAARANPRVTDDTDVGAIADAALALGEAAPARALEALGVVRDTLRLDVVLALRSESLQELGRLAEAREAARQLAERWYFGTEWQDFGEHARFREGLLALQLGDMEGGRRALGAFVSRWSDGDAALPSLTLARRRLQSAFPRLQLREELPRGRTPLRPPA